MMVININEKYNILTYQAMDHSEPLEPSEHTKSDCGKYTEKDLLNTIPIDGLHYIREKNSDKPLEDPILYTHILQTNAILVNCLIYDVDTIYRYLKTTSGNTDLYRQTISPTKINEITKKYNEVNKELLRNSDKENISGLSRQEIMNEVRSCLVRQYQLYNGLNYYPQTRQGIELVSMDQRKIRELDARVDTLMLHHSWLKSSAIMNKILRNESSEMKSSLSRWIQSFDA